jgi:hypothetical protein
VKNQPHTCGSYCVLPCPGAQLELRFDLSDVSDEARDTFGDRVRAYVGTLQASMGKPLRSLDAELAECPMCGGAGEVFFDRADARGEHTTEHVPCAGCRDIDDAGLLTASEVSGRLSACR